MDKLSQVKKIIKLSDSDKKILLAYSNATSPEKVLKFTPEAEVNKKLLKNFH